MRVAIVDAEMQDDLKSDDNPKHRYGGEEIKVLELFAGTRSIGKAFEARGHEVYSIDWDSSFSDIDLCADISEVTAKDILDTFGHPDVIWASPDCTTYSIAAISHHRKKDKETGNLNPVSEYAKQCDKTNTHVLNLIRELNPVVFFVENPRGGVKEDGVYTKLTSIHDDILSVWRHKNETDRHLDQSSRPKIQAALQKWFTLSCKGSERGENRYAGFSWRERTSCYPEQALRTHS